ncbi:MAG: TonB-dependent receptor, partial [Proteobacteria bacterium]
MRKTSSAVTRAVAATLAISATSTTPVQAQDAEIGRNVETIIVTAQKREQNLQDVPIAVTAVSGELLQDTGVRDIKDLTILTPGLIVTSTQNETITTARIRGIGTVGDNPGLESSVGVVIDGVYRPRNGVSFGDLGQVERIEVLKGPQGTLFGKNTSAGVINVLTRRPQFEFGSEVELTAGNFGALEGSASLTGPLFGDTVAGHLYAAVRERDGFYDVVRGQGPRSEDEDYDRSFYTVRGQLLLQPTDVLDVRLIADYTSRDENCCLAPQAILSGAAPVLGALSALEPGSFANPADPFERLTYANRGTEQNIHDKGVSAEINWDLQALGGATLTSISAARNWRTVNGQDADFTAVDIWYRSPEGFSNEFDTFSQELRLAGETERVSWMVGAFYAAEDLESRSHLIYGTQYRDYLTALLGQPAFMALLPPTAWPADVGTQDTYEQESRSWALFTNNSIRLTERLEATLGLRYTDESKDLVSQYRNPHGGGGRT